MSYARLPLQVIDGVVGRVLLNQLRDNLDAMLAQFAAEHATADGVFDVGQSRVGAHSGATSFGGGNAHRGSYLIRWDQPAVIRGADEFLGPVSIDNLSGDGTALIFKVRGMTTVAAVAMPRSLSTSTNPKFCEVRVREAPNDSQWPWRVEVEPVEINSGMTAGAFDFSLVIWGA